MTSPPPSTIPSMVERDSRDPVQSSHIDPSFLRSSEPYGWPSSASHRSHFSKASWNWPSDHNSMQSPNHPPTPGGRRPLPQPYSGASSAGPAGGQSSYGTHPAVGDAPLFAPQFRQPPAPSEVGMGSSQSGDVMVVSDNGETRYSYYPDGDQEYDNDNDYDAEGPMESMELGGPEMMNAQQEGTSQRRPRGRAMTFVGGFVSGLRRLPNMMTRTNGGVSKAEHEKRLAMKKDTYGMQDDQGTTSTLPRYEDPGQPIPGPSNAAVTYVEAMSMPTEEHASTHLSHADDFSLERPLENPHELYASPVSYSHQSQSHSRSHQSQSHRSQPRRSPARSQTIGSQSMSGRSSVAPHGLGSPYAESPIQVDPRPTDDYQKMTVPPRFEVPDDSFSAHFNRLQSFFRELRDLPWLSPRITVDYYPAESRRARAGEKVKAAGGSWYTQRDRQSIDLLEPAAMMAMPHAGMAGVRTDMQRGYSTTYGNPQTHSPPNPQAAYYQNSRSRSQRAPTTRGTPLGHPPMTLAPSPGPSTHGPGPLPVSYSYYLANPPRPLYVIPSPYSSPRAGMISPGGEGGGAEGAPMEGPNALPLYMVTAPSPMMAPKSPAPAHLGTLHGRPEPLNTGAGPSGSPAGNSAGNSPGKVDGQGASGMMAA